MKINKMDMKGRERKKKGFGERGKSSTLSNYEFSSSIKSYDSTTSVRSNISRGGVGGLSSVTSSRQYTLEGGRRNSALDCMLKCCFRSNYSLRFQLFLSFGIVTLVSIGFVMLIAILTSIESGIFVRSLSRDNLENWASRNVEEGSRYIAETITQKLSTLEGLSRILKETTQERFMGYPNHPLYYNDGLVPFTDIYTKQHRYPLKASDKNKLPLEWNYQQNVNPQNAQEHLQHRYDWYQDHQVGTASAAFRMQGACDPSVTDTQSSLYYHNCTQHNNDMTTGGIIAPTLTLESIHSKTSDYATAVLKPLYEYHKDVAILGIYFANDGAGAVTVFPSFPLDGRRNFTSAGCEFLRQPNPHNNNSENRTIGTQEQINRCHKKGDNVNQRDYNPLERTWCQTMALDPSKVHSIGPYEDAIRGDGLLTFGQGIYDKVTNEFIGCTLADISVDQFKQILEDVKLTNSTKIALVRWNEEGTVVASTGWGNNFVPGNVVNVTNLDGISLESFQAKKDLFQTSWQNEDFDSTQFRSSLSFGGHYFAGFPVPVPPKEYDPAYRPEFMLILSVTKDEVLGTVDRLDDEIDSRVENLILWSLVGGFLGIVFVLLIIHFVSIYLTQPMNWMNSVGDGIVRSYGEQGPIIPPSESSWWRYAPKTEITALVVEFQSMIEKFSGSGTAKLHRQREMEIQNPFDLISNFTTLYESRNATRLKYNYDDPAASGFHDSTNDSKFTMGMPWRKHWGPNIHCVTEEEKEEEEVSTSSGSLRRLTGEQDKRVVKSRLFWWIFGSIAIPLLATMLAIAAYVAYRISQSMPDVSHEVERAYIDLEVGSLDSIVRIRAAYAAEVVSSYIRDLHVYYRIMGWLLFGALERSDSFTSMTSLTEQCKDQEEGKCNYDPNLAVCDCKWKDRWGYACQHYDHDTREYQNMWFINNVEDAMPNGDRLNTSFPKVGDDPTTTAWIGSAEDAAGASKGVNASGYDTTYERLRIQSAASMIAIPLLNYVHGTSLVGSTGVYSAFERDGSLMGYSGCEHYHTNAAFFFSDEESVHKNSTHLCPYGKYGYDVRCRDWYVAGKETASRDEGDLLHVTPPFIFSDDEDEDVIVISSADLSWIDPETKEYVGLAAIDVDTTPIIKKLNNKQTPLPNNGFYVLITTHVDQFSHDTIVGPDFQFGANSSNVKDLLLKHDVCNDQDKSGCHNLEHFENNVFEKMVGGESNQSHFYRRAGPDSPEDELVHFSYASVDVRSFRPINASNMESGVKAYTSGTLSIALGETLPGLLSTFDAIEQQLDRIVNISVSVMSILILVAFVVVAYVSTKVVASIIIPVMHLLDLVRKINRFEVNEDLPEIRGGSSEVTKVRDTFERLYMIVRFANSAFFAGDLQKAHETLKGALELFTKLQNSKAIGITNNNLGNTMMTMYRAMKKTKSHRMRGMSKDKIIRKGITYYKSAIDIGESAIERINEEEGWSTNYLIYMQQLSNRYFNRGIFLLTVKEDHPDPYEAERQGLMDLSTAKDMDREVVDNGDRHGFKGDQDVYFDLLLSRIKGVIQLLDMGFADDWGLDDLFADANRELMAALDDPDHILFRDMHPAAQMQRLDALLIEYYRLGEEKSPEKAAKIAIRMMVEDEYVMSDAAAKALKALIEFTDQTTAAQLGGEDPSNVKAALYRLRKHVAETESLLHSGRDLVSKEMFRQSQVGDFFMEEF